MKKSGEQKLELDMLKGEIYYFKNFEKLYGPIIQELNQNGVYGPNEFNKKYMLKSSLKGNYVPLMDVKNNYIPKSELPDYIKRYETNKRNAPFSNKALKSSLNEASALLRYLQTK